MTEPCAVAVIGAGAAGLAAAIRAAERLRETGNDQAVVLLDGAERPGAKILISGGGRCNVTHGVVRAEDFNGRRGVIRSVLATFGVHATVSWFDELGVPLKREATGKLFPVANRAQSVLSALLRRCDELGVTLCPGRRVSDITPSGSSANPGFVIRHSYGELCAGRVVLCTGGRSLPRSGSDGSGWEIVRRLGHSVTPTFPALVPLLLVPSMFHARLSGVSQHVELSTVADGKSVDRRSGSLLWTHFGISGPVVLDASRHWRAAVLRQPAGGAVELRCNLFPGRSFEQVERDLLAQAAAQPHRSLAKALATAMPERVAVAVTERAGLDPATPLGQLPRSARRELCHALVELVLPVSGDRGWNYAEVTAGGVPLDEINPRSMESRRVPGLYLAGELLDCDGRIGGFNFQWAWSTGYLAGRAAGTG